MLEKGWYDFFEDTVPTNPQKAEYLLPTLIGSLLRNGECTVKVLETNDKWVRRYIQRGQACGRGEPLRNLTMIIHDGKFEETIAAANEYLTGSEYQNNDCLLCQAKVFGALAKSYAEELPVEATIG